MTQKTITITTLSAFLMLAFAVTAFAGPGYGQRGFAPNGPFSQLTPEKQEEVKKIFDKYDAEFDGLRVKMQTKYAVLQAMVNGGEADEAKIGKLTQDISDLHNKVRDTREAMAQEVEKTTGLKFPLGRGGCQSGCARGGQGGPQQCPGYGQGRMARGMN